MKALDITMKLVEIGLIPDRIIRSGIRHLLRVRLKEIGDNDIQNSAESKHNFINMMNESPLAVSTQKANEQHYEIPEEFYTRVLGANLKYSSGYWPAGTKTMDDAELAALTETCSHAELKDGDEILELGCGWGSLSLFMAKLYPNSKITAVSNSSTQKKYIDQKIEKYKLKNLKIITADMNDFHPNVKYDRIVSVEMIEHMRNYKELFRRISSWLKLEGKFFMHIFVHKNNPYLFEDRDESDWMSRYFFSGGMMPSDDLPLYFQDDLKIVRKWTWNGLHYAKTLNLWLSQMDRSRGELVPLFEKIYGINSTAVWWNRWRMFFMACAELFAYDKGRRWYVNHYLFQKR